MFQSHRFRLLPVFLLCALMSAAANAAEAPSVPIVLVLKLVSDTSVQPITGVVVSADGNVVVPAHFVREGDEIVVMDGGTDIVKHARPAKLVARSEIAGLALLSVQDMRRPPVRFAQLISPSEGDLHYAAFPDAQRMAEGEAPLWLPVDVKPSPVQGEWFVTNVDTLPAIDGLVLDNCGQLAGIALASYPPSPYVGQSRMIMGGRLVASLKELDVSLSSVFCDATAGSQRAAEEQLQQDGPYESAAPQAVTEKLEKEPEKRDPPDLLDRKEEAAVENEPALPAGDPGATSDSAMSLNDVTQENTSIWSLVPVWLWLLMAALLGALAFKLGTLWRLVNRTPDAAGNQAPRHAPVVEPATIELLAGSPAGLRPAQFEEPMPDITALPEGFNAIVSVVGQFANGKSFCRYCIVDKAHIDIIIGRGDADISIPGAYISRQHARLKGTANALTFSDLGSDNGTSIGAVPCLPGEIMFIEPNDEITLADARFRIGVKVRYDQPS